MQIRPTMTTGAVLAIMLVGPVFQAIGEPSPNVTVAVSAKSSRAKLAQLQAPVGHRQPTQNDLPPSVREEEAPHAEATPQGSTGDGQRGRLREQRRTPSVQPFDGADGVPRICDPC
jgi:hypothetical protein